MAWCISFIEALIADISESVDKPIHFYGCTESDLQHIMTLQKISRLPELYRQFMLHMGCGFETRWDDMVWEYPKLLELEQAMGKFDLDNKFVFMWHNIHQCAIFCFSVDDDLDDPPVLYWTEECEEFELRPYAISPLSAFLVNFFAPD